MQDDILRTTELSSLGVVRYLKHGEIQSADDARAIDASGKAPLRDTLALAELTKLYLYWRDVSLAVLSEEACLLGLEPGILDEAVAAVRYGSDGGMVRMAKQFDVERKRLQRDLAIEQARLEHHAFHDALTGLPNRRLFFDRLSHALQLSNRHSARVGLLFVDVDQFKAINDRLGHDAGDRVLIALASRLVEGARAADTVARLGGDEFVVLYERVDDPQREGVVLAERISAAIREPIAVLDEVIQLSASIGIACMTSADDVDGLIRCADDAMYIAKRQGPGKTHVWESNTSPVPDAHRRW